MSGRKKKRRAVEEEGGGIIRAPEYKGNMIITNRIVNTKQIQNGRRAAECGRDGEMIYLDQDEQMPG